MTHAIYDMEFLKSTLRFEEGVDDDVYQDHFGNDTIGVGFLVDRDIPGAGIPEPVINFWLDYLLKECIEDLESKIKSWHLLPPHVRSALILMRYQLGMPTLARFKKTLTFVEAGDFIEAGDESLDSKWAKQTPDRAGRVAALMRGD